LFNFELQDSLPPWSARLQKFETDKLAYVCCAEG